MFRNARHRPSRYDRETDPARRPNDAIIRTTASLICTSDIHTVPREARGVGMRDKSIRTALCPGGSVRMSRLLRLIETGRVDPLALTTHRFQFTVINCAGE